VSTDAWPRLSWFSDTYTCYSSAIATWLAHDVADWPGRLNPGLWLTVSDRGDSLFGFGHFAPSLRAALGLERRGADDPGEAIEAVAAELDRSGRAIVAGDGFRLPWHVAFERVHVPHWFVLARTAGETVVLDPFACRNELGLQEAARVPVSLDELSIFGRALPHGDPVLFLRESLALGGEDETHLDRAFQWFVPGTPGAPRDLDSIAGPDAILRLSRHFRERGQHLDAYRQADDLWSVGRHRAFLARFAAEVAEREADASLTEWIDTHVVSLVRRWGHIPPLLMQARLALQAGRPASESVAETLEDLARLERAAGEAYPREGSPADIDA
jgi:hypothetical protein